MKKVFVKKRRLNVVKHWSLTLLSQNASTRGHFTMNIGPKASKSALQKYQNSKVAWLEVHRKKFYKYKLKSEICKVKKCFDWFMSYGQFVLKKSVMCWQKTESKLNLNNWCIDFFKNLKKNRVSFSNSAWKLSTIDKFLT